MADHGIIADLKSAIDAGRRGFTRALGNLGYHRKAAFYVDGMRQAMGSWSTAHAEVDYDHFLFIAFEKIAPFAVAVYHLDPDYVEIGRDQCNAMLRLYAECKAADKWPAYPTDITLISAPEWTRYQLEDMEPHATD
jgi:exodeoxyribonuclease VIII